MTSAHAVEAHFCEHISVIKSTLDLSLEPLLQFSSVLVSSLEKGGTIFVCGNGGSASDSQHIAAELLGRFSINRQPLRAVSLASDISSITCISNDFSYEDIFSRQVEALARQGDVLFAISTSGNSSNVVAAIQQAKSMGVSSLAFLGKDGGVCKPIADYSIVVPSYSTARVQETHILLAHILCDMIEKNLGLVSHE
ncbi:SIS domain-containing protein [Synechococcus sp. UW105]|uniref:D-sedoheptulose-7-phosphate isomerase n=1 Tax=Synechococcus sp. UW105 TaxID=337067 RepID=UPI000E0E0B96|nr:SIS domain-containing protein [Synechococcus sp. UW105]